MHSTVLYWQLITYSLSRLLIALHTGISIEKYKSNVKTRTRSNLTSYLLCCLQKKKYILSKSESVQCKFFIFFDHVTFTQFKICCCVIFYYNRMIFRWDMAIYLKMVTVRYLGIVLPPYETTHEVSVAGRSCLSNFMSIWHTDQITVKLLSNAMHGQNINLPVCVSVCLSVCPSHFPSIRLQVRPSTDFYSW